MKNSILIIILIAGLIIGGVIGFLQGKGGKGVSCPEVSKAPKEQVAQKVLDFLNEEILKEQNATASLVRVIEETGLYKVTINVQGENIQGGEFDSYATFDGKIFFPEGYNLEGTAPVVEEPEKTERTPESLEDFAKCLTEKGMKFYEASWCGWCKKQKELFGEAVEFLPYVECIDEQTNEMTQGCKDAGVSSFPTWKLPSGEMSPGYKELDKLAELSGCVLE